MDSTESKKVILDCDTGEDDALAILLALNNNLPLEYVVTSYGNSTLENATRNTSRILSLSQAAEVKVLPGADGPLEEHLLGKDPNIDAFIGKNGLCNVELPPSQLPNILPVSPENYQKTLIEIITTGGKKDYIITGPCTNFATVCKELGEDITKYIDKLYIMGGAIHVPGNSGPEDPITHLQAAEFNFYGDPNAAKIVLESGVPIYMVTWDLTSSVTISYHEIETFVSDSAVGQFVITLMKSFFEFYGLEHDRNFELNDPLTILAYLGYGSYQNETITVLTTGDAYGKVIIDDLGTDVRTLMMTEAEKELAVAKIIADLGIRST